MFYSFTALLLLNKDILLISYSSALVSQNTC
jgi:hypothetical protein